MRACLTESETDTETLGNIAPSPACHVEAPGSPWSDSVQVQRPEKWEGVWGAVSPTEACMTREQTR